MSANLAPVVVPESIEADPAALAEHPAGPASDRASRRVVSLRLIVPLAAVLLISAALLSSTLVAEHDTRTSLVRETEVRLLLEARNLSMSSAGALLAGFPELTLQPIVRRLVSERPEIVFAVVVDRDGLIQAHPDAQHLGQPFRVPPDLAPVRFSARLVSGEALLADHRLLVARAPIGQRPGAALGTVYVGMRRDHVESAVARARARQRVLLAGMLGAGGILTLLLMSALLRPMAPLRAGLARIANGDLTTPIVLKDRTELGELAATVNHMAARLSAAQRAALERQRLASEIALAARIQTSLLPPPHAVFGRVSIAGAQRPATEVGGDFYQYLSLPDGRLALVMADVSGKGVAGCLVTAMLVALFKAYRTLHDSPAAMILALGENLQATLQRGTFVTLWYGILDPATGRLTHASAGHLPLLVYRRGRATTEWHRATGVPIGAVGHQALCRTVRDEVTVLGAGDIAVQLTDGFTEAPSGGRGEMLGLERVAEIVRRSAGRGPRAIVEAMSEAAGAWRRGPVPHDDETILVVAFDGEATAGGIDRAATATPDAALHLLEAAARGGACLRLPARLEELDRVKDWMRGIPGVAGLGERGERLLESALHEACANAIEHACSLDPSMDVELWWSPAAPPGGLAEGRFVLVDQGRAFDPAGRTPPQPGETSFRRRGRGYGLEMIYRIMSEVSFFAGTSRGNLMVMRFDPGRMTDV
jgi:serine phosphatase RsbU (regulator of sigma subunit)/anti-sigma regulatory factor (Ser/Thr protein kinase)